MSDAGGCAGTCGGDFALSDSIRPPSSLGELPCHDLGQPTMIHLLPRASDGVAEPRLQSLDPGRASERPFASGPPAVFPWAAPNNLPHQRGESPGTARCQGCERQIWHTCYDFFFFFSFFSDFNNPMC